MTQRERRNSKLINIWRMVFVFTLPNQEAINLEMFLLGKTGHYFDLLWQLRCPYAKVPVELGNTLSTL